MCYANVFRFDLKPEIPFFCPLQIKYVGWLLFWLSGLDEKVFEPKLCFFCLVIVWSVSIFYLIACACEAMRDPRVENTYHLCYPLLRSLSFSISSGGTPFITPLGKLSGFITQNAEKKRGMFDGKISILEFFPLYLWLWRHFLPLSLFVSLSLSPALSFSLWLSLTLFYDLNGVGYRLWVCNSLVCCFFYYSSPLF